MARKNFKLSNLSYNDDRYKTSYLLVPTIDQPEESIIPDSITEEIVSIFPNEHITVMNDVIFGNQTQEAQMNLDDFGIEVVNTNE